MIEFLKTVPSNGRFFVLVPMPPLFAKQHNQQGS